MIRERDRAMRVLSALLIAAALFLPASAPAFAGEFLPSIQKIADRGTLVIAVVDGARPPMISREQGTPVAGFDVELGEDIARALGVEAKFVAAGRRGINVIDKVAAGEADIGLSYLSESVEAGRRVFFSRPYMIEAHTVLVDRVKAVELGDDCPSVSDLRRLAATPGRVGSLRQSPFAAIADSGAETKVTLFDDVESLIAAVQAGEILVSVQGELEAKYYLSRHPQAAIRLKYCHVPNVRHRVSVAVRPGAIGLVRWIDLYLAQRGVIIDLDTLIYRADRSVY